ncbi:EbsA family protein [Streptococcus dentiloxodontae]
MIKIFGKYRYHWQPELSWLIIYWSIAIIPIFIGAAMIFERYDVPIHVLALFSLFAILFCLGLHRYFVIEDDGILKIISLNIFKPRKVQIADIKRVEVTKTGLLLISKDDSRRQFYMRKWPKKYFLDALAVHKDFKGEVELTDHMVRFDYFAFYEESKKLSKSFFNHKQ